MMRIKIPFAQNFSGEDSDAPMVKVTFLSPQSGKVISVNNGLADSGAAVCAAPFEIMKKLELPPGEEKTCYTASNQPIEGCWAETIFQVDGFETIVDRDGDEQIIGSGTLTARLPVFFTEQVLHSFLGRQDFLRLLSPQFDFRKREIIVTLDEDCPITFQTSFETAPIIPAKQSGRKSPDLDR